MADPKKATDGEFRRFPTYLATRKTSLRAQSPNAKASYFVMALRGESYGLGMTDFDELALFVGCTKAEAEQALTELLHSGLISFDVDTGVYWLHDLPASVETPNHAKHVQSTLQQFPPSWVLDAFIELSGLPSEWHPHGIGATSSRHPKHKTRQDQTVQNSTKQDLHKTSHNITPQNQTGTVPTSQSGARADRADLLVEDELDRLAQQKRDTEAYSNALVEAD